jgi:hypothetical protein
MENKCRLCKKQLNEHTEKMHAFQKTEYAVNFPSHVLVAKNQTKKKAPNPTRMKDGMAERETFAGESAPAADATEATEATEELSELPEASEVKVKPTFALEETFDGVIVAFHQQSASGFIRKLDGAKGSGLFFGAESVLTAGELRIGTKVRFKSVQQTFKEASQPNNTAFKAVDIEIYE